MNDHEKLLELEKFWDEQAELGFVVMPEYSLSLVGKQILEDNAHLLSMPKYHLFVEQKFLEAQAEIARHILTAERLIGDR